MGGGQLIAQVACLFTIEKRNIYITVSNMFLDGTLLKLFVQSTHVDFLSA